MYTTMNESVDLAAPESMPTDERIRQRAHQLYVERGNESGSELDDWLQAEQEILAAQDQQREG